MMMMMMKMMTRNLYKGMKEPLMTAESFETMRLGLVSLTILYRLLIMPRYLQAYLNIAYDKVNPQDDQFMSHLLTPSVLCRLPS